MIERCASRTREPTSQPEASSVQNNSTVPSAESTLFSPGPVVVGVSVVTPAAPIEATAPAHTPVDLAHDFAQPVNPPSLASPSDAPPVLPTEISETLSYITVKSMFISWYADEIYNCSTRPNSKERRYIRMIARLICYCKNVLPEGTRIDKKPTDATALEEWMRHLVELSTVAQDKISALVEQDPSVLKKRNRDTTDMISATYKRLLATKTESWPTVSPTVDQATSAGFNFPSGVAQARKPRYK